MLQYEQIGDYSKVVILQHIFYVFNNKFVPLNGNADMQELLARSDFVINTRENKIIKNREGTLENLLDNFVVNTIREPYKQRDHLNFAIKLPKEEQFDCQWYNEQFLTKDDIVNWAKLLAEDCVKAGDGNSYNKNINNTLF